MYATARTVASRPPAATTGSTATACCTRWSLRAVGPLPQPLGEDPGLAGRARRGPGLVAGDQGPTAQGQARCAAEKHLQHRRQVPQRPARDHVVPGRWHVQRGPVHLETTGQLDMDPRLQGCPISAHSKVDERTGELLFFAYGKEAPYMHYGVMGGTARSRPSCPCSCRARACRTTWPSPSTTRCCMTSRCSMTWTR
jgi:hypothetical protein